MGYLDVPVMGYVFRVIFPIILVILILFNVFDLYKKILTAIGLKQFEFSDDFEDERIDDGKIILAKERKRCEKLFLDYIENNKGQMNGYVS